MWPAFFFFGFSRGILMLTYHADHLDRAADLAERERAVLVAQPRPMLPAGQPGECQECGHQRPRLINGICPFCIDGRDVP